MADKEPPRKALAATRKRAQNRRIGLPSYDDKDIPKRPGRPRVRTCVDRKVSRVICPFACLIAHIISWSSDFLSLSISDIGQHSRQLEWFMSCSTRVAFVAILITLITTGSARIAWALQSGLKWSYTAASFVYLSCLLTTRNA